MTVNPDETSTESTYSQPLKIHGHVSDLFEASNDCCDRQRERKDAISCATSTSRLLFDNQHGPPTTINPLLTIASHQWFDRLFNPVPVNHTTSPQCPQFRCSASSSTFEAGDIITANETDKLAISHRHVTDRRICENTRTFVNAMTYGANDSNVHTAEEIAKLTHNNDTFKLFSGDLNETLGSPYRTSAFLKLNSPEMNRLTEPSTTYHVGELNGTSKACNFGDDENRYIPHIQDHLSNSTISQGSNYQCSPDPDASRDVHQNVPPIDRKQPMEPRRMPASYSEFKEQSARLDETAPIETIFYSGKRDEDSTCSSPARLDRLQLPPVTTTLLPAQASYPECNYENYSHGPSKYLNFSFNEDKSMTELESGAQISNGFSSAAVLPPPWLFDYPCGTKLSKRLTDVWAGEDDYNQANSFPQTVLTTFTHPCHTMIDEQPDTANQSSSFSQSSYAYSFDPYAQPDSGVIADSLASTSRYASLFPYSHDHSSVDAATAAAAVAMATNLQTNFHYQMLPPMGGFLPTNHTHSSSILTRSRFSTNGHPRFLPQTIEVHTPETNYNPRELEAFSERFKQRRIKLGVTQADVGKALGNLKIAGVGSLSQSTICRFESLTLSHNNMVALKPVLQAWLEEAEAEAAERQRHPEVYDPAEERRRKRTSITDAEKRSLEAFFSVQPRPSSEKIAQIAEKLNLKKNVVRVWFCNQRQKQKRMKFSTLGLLHHASSRS